MNNIEFHGTIAFEPKTYEWSGAGTGWWIKESMGNVAKIDFAEPIAFDEQKDLMYKDYSLSVSNINSNGRIETFNVSESGFYLRWEDFSQEPCIASFFVSGTKVNVVPDDRELTTEQNVADIYASKLLFDYQAEYGVITVMGSASIEAKETIESRIEMINDFAKDIEADIVKEKDDSRKQKMQHKVDLANTRIKHQNTIEEKCTQYWESAHKFGMLWGRYAVNDQEKELGGCYVPICTGGGAGIMGAVAKGAREENAHVLGIDCQFGKEKFYNLEKSKSIYSNVRLRMNNMSIREAVLINYSHVILFWPGGFGTAWEVCETLSKLQTDHLRKNRVKAIFVHKDYWDPFFKLLDHMRDFGTIKDKDRIRILGVDDSRTDDCYIGEVVDTPEEAFEKARSFVEELYKKNHLVIRGE